MSTAQKFRETVDGINEEARWTRMDLASQRVHPAYRDAWRRARTDWGSDVQIADSEVTNLHIEEERDEGTSVVVVRWYRYDTMTLQTSTLKQTWRKVDGTFVLWGEEIVSGDEGIFLAESPEDAPSDSAPGA